jgi:hypothetical protein
MVPMEEEGLAIARSISWLQWYQLKVLCGNEHEKSFHASAAVSVCAGAMARACTHDERARPDGRLEETGYVGCVVACISWMDGHGLGLAACRLGAAGMSCLAVAYDLGFDTPAACLRDWLFRATRR